MLHGIRPAVAHQIHLLFLPFTVILFITCGSNVGATACFDRGAQNRTRFHQPQSRPRARAPPYFQEVNQIARNFLRVLLC